jgi:hypothetical protein
MPILHFMTHPQVMLDPSVAVPDRALSPEGVRRMYLAVERPWISRVDSVSAAQSERPPMPRGSYRTASASRLSSSRTWENNHAATWYSTQG